MTEQNKTENLKLFNSWKTVPAEYQKPIKAKRYDGKGLTEINPMWRIQKLTETFGPIGFGWYYEEKEHWTETVGNNTAVFVRIHLNVYKDGIWSKPIEGNGGSTIAGTDCAFTDEAHKMAVTDAIGVACKQLGIGADVYFDKNKTNYGTKYEERPQPAATGKGRGSAAAITNGEKPELNPKHTSWNSNVKKVATLLAEGKTAGEIFTRITSKFYISSKNLDALLKQARDATGKTTQS